MANDGNHGHRIVMTGGPGGGKTTAADMLRRELGADRVTLVPEAATLLFSGGFPRREDASSRRASQLAIYHVQKNLENVQIATHPERLLLCDRGTIDGAAYWPGTPDDFFEAVGSTLERELVRYDAVIFFESAAVGGLDIRSGNPVRTEGAREAALLDERLREIWAKHPRFHLIRHQTSFLEKIRQGVEAFERVVAEIDADGAD